MAFIKIHKLLENISTITSHLKYISLFCTEDTREVGLKPEHLNQIWYNMKKYVLTNKSLALWSILILQSIF